MRLRQKPTMNTQSTSTKSGTMPAVGRSTGSLYSRTHGVSIQKPEAQRYEPVLYALIDPGRKSWRPKAMKEKGLGRLVSNPGPWTASSPRVDRSRPPSCRCSLSWYQSMARSYPEPPLKTTPLTAMRAVVMSRVRAKRRLVR